ncbi:MAG: phenylalanine-4-hydroxylase [Crocinitomicaceae bacterium]
MKQIFENYTDEDHEVWRILFERQKENLTDKACNEYLTALEEMKEVLHPNSIPRFTELNQWFAQRTGWEIHCVPGLIPVDEFFELLAQKKFCSSTWLRLKSQLDYLEEPDMFHDIFGHVPLLSLPTYSNFMHEFGKLGVAHKENSEIQIYLQRLYWFTIEFGLIKDDLKIYGAGILSSFGESIECRKDIKQKLEFNIEEVILKPYDSEKIQNEYVMIESFEALFESLKTIELKFKSNELVNTRK